MFENGLCSEKYLLMKDIKKAKMLMPMAGKGIFCQGVPISIHRETLVQRLLSSKEFLDCVGINTGKGVAVVRKAGRIPSGLYIRQHCQAV
jgi:hypothetical protein